MNFGEGERRRTIRTSSEHLTKGAEITAFWRVLTQSPVAMERSLRERGCNNGCRPGKAVGLNNTRFDGVKFPDRR